MGLGFRGSMDFMRRKPYLWWLSRLQGAKGSKDSKGCKGSSINDLFGYDTSPNLT